MADDYSFAINVFFTIEVKHLFSKDEVEDVGGIREAIKSFGEELLEDIEFNVSPDISLVEFPEKKSKNNKYLYKFYCENDISFDEDDVDIAGECLIDGVLDEYIKEWKERLKAIDYPVKEIEIFEGIIRERIRGKLVKPHDMAKRLIKKYDYSGNYYLSKKEFKRISGRENLRDSFIDHVDSKLREEGYLLIDLIHEKDIIAVSNIDSIMDWYEIA